MDYFWFKPIQLEWVGQRKMERARAGGVGWAFPERQRHGYQIHTHSIG